jgi:hypothetical protein
MIVLIEGSTNLTQMRSVVKGEKMDVAEAENTLCCTRTAQLTLLMPNAHTHS